MHSWNKYISDVQKGKRLAGRLEKLTVDRFVRLRKKKEYYFDVEEVKAILEIVGHFRHTKGKYYGVQWKLMPWQAFFFAYIFGLKHKKSDLRVVRKVLLCMAKKGGKSEVAGALGVLMAFFDGENGAECYSAANKYDQAKFSWDAAKKILKQMSLENDYINTYLKVYDSITTRSLINLEDESYFRPIAADSTTLDGVNPHLGLMDEFHAAKDSSIPDNLESGMVAREQPLLVITTTRGFNSRGVLRELEDNYIAILEGKQENDSVFPFIFSLDEDDDWQDEKVWAKANPGIGIAPSLEGLREEYKKAITEGATREINFKTKNLNIWTNVASVWIQDDIWYRETTEYGAQDLMNKICFGGLDLASTRDLAAFTLLFPPEHEGEKYRQLSRYYCPEEKIDERSRQDRIPYRQWVKDGWLIATPGNIIDYDYIEYDILECTSKFDLRGISYDKHNGSKLMPKLVEAGIICNSFYQSPGNFNAPIKELERLAVGNQWLKINSDHTQFGNVLEPVPEKKDLLKSAIHHDVCFVHSEDSYFLKMSALFDQGKDPIMRWAAGNVVLFISRDGNVKFDKEKAREKIDPMVALGMAFGEYLDQKEDTESVYNKRDIIMF